jgi:hypothetical protein
MTLLEKYEELRKRTLFLWRKAKNGQPCHLKQVLNVLGGLNVSWCYPLFEEGWSIDAKDKVMLCAIANKVIPDAWEWEIQETMRGDFELRITGFNQSL